MSRTVSTPDAHVFLGLGLLLASLIVLILAVAGRMGSRVIRMSALLFVLILLQPVFMALRYGDLTFLSSLHTLNAAVIGVTSGVLVKAGQMAAAQVQNSAEPIPATASD
jgi:hypothetical protein